jgi:hypothetical protein
MPRPYSRACLRRKKAVRRIGGSEHEAQLARVMSDIARSVHNTKASRRTSIEGAVRAACAGGRDDTQNPTENVRRLAKRG